MAGGGVGVLLFRIVLEFPVDPCYNGSVDRHRPVMFQRLGQRPDGADGLASIV